MAILTNILDSVRCRIIELNLQQIEAANIKTISVFNQRETVDFTMPGILISPLGPETIPPTAGTNTRDDIGYPVAVAIMDETVQDTGTNLPAGAQTGAPDQEYNLDIKLNWRESIRKKFFHQRLEGVSAVWTCHIEPMPIIDTVEWQSRGGIWISMLVLRFWTRENRIVPIN